MQLPFAEQACRAVLAAQPERGDAWLLLARIVMEASRLEEVDALLTKADRCKAHSIEVQLARASLLWRMGRDEECFDVSRRVLALRPNDQESICRMASCERRLGRPRDALRRLQPHLRSPMAATIAAWAHLDAGDPAAAKAVALPCADAPGLAAALRSNLWHVIGLAHEQLGEYGSALASYTASKQAIPITVDEKAMRRNFHELRSTFSAEFLRSAPRAGLRTERPVFIAAMPRSGTTLLDRIIAAHPEGAGAGETRALRGQVAAWTGSTEETRWPGIVRTFTPEDLDRIATRYLKETDQFGPRAARTADKHLMNWVSVGLIEMAFPAARVIHLRRDPMDVGISCFERLRTGSIAWCGSLRSIGLALKACEVLLAHWKAVATIPILTVEYESLVRHPVEETKRIIEFLGLPWDDRCLRRERESRGDRGRIEPPPTLASEQAARPLYDSAIGRGARFGAALDPLREAFAEPFEE